MSSFDAPARPHVIVVGGGFGGIASALRCRAMGARVTLIERLDRLGGRAQVFQIDGFKHDAGPTVITAPFDNVSCTESAANFEEAIDRPSTNCILLAPLVSTIVILPLAAFETI